MSEKEKINRRAFIKNSSLLTAGIGLTGLGLSSAGLADKRLMEGSPEALPKAARLKNAIPKWKGFNFLDFFSPDPQNSRGTTPEDHFRWMADWGFDFVRVPMAYPYYLDIDRSQHITPEQVYNIDERMVDKIDHFVSMAHKHGLHVSLNLHRAPGYCVNSGFHEPYNLWKDQEALNAFCHHWEMWATRYKNYTNEQISFDLVNEPSMREDMNDQHSERSSVPGHLYRRLAKAASERIRSVNPGHMVIADGNDVGSSVIPEITDLDIAQSCRGYFPGIISNYKAPWAFKDTDSMPQPTWPGQVGDQYLSREMLEEHYKPWFELVQQGVGVHCGECGCYNKTPHDVFLAWFSDVLGLLSENGIGFALWELKGDFGILDSGRSDVAYEDWYGHKLDRKLLNLLMKV